MPIPTPALESHLMEMSQQRAAKLLRAFLSDVEAGNALPALSARASLVVDSYCDGLLGELMTAVVPVCDDEHEWVRRHYLPLVIEFGTAVRDAIADPTSRHAVAQTIQCRILEHERQLRTATDLHPLAHPEVFSKPDGDRHGRDHASPVANQESSAKL